MIDSFKDEHRFLSNFYPARVLVDVFAYPTVEHAFQASKTVDAYERNMIRTASKARDAKALGRTITLRPGWDDMRLDVMEELLRQKFDPMDDDKNDLVVKLLSTYPVELIEGNWWNDTFWGVCNGVGENHLGKLLMKIRQEIVDEIREKVLP